MKKTPNNNTNKNAPSTPPTSSMSNFMMNPQLVQNYANLYNMGWMQLQQNAQSGSSGTATTTGGAPTQNSFLNLLNSDLNSPTTFFRQGNNSTPPNAIPNQTLYNQAYLSMLQQQQLLSASPVPMTPSTPMTPMTPVSASSSGASSTAKKRGRPKKQESPDDDEEEVDRSFKRPKTVSTPPSTPVTPAVSIQIATPSSASQAFRSPTISSADVEGDNDSDDDEDEAKGNTKQKSSASAQKKKEKKPQKKRGLFTKELGAMMHAFGDVKQPLQETVDLMEEIALDYIHDMTNKAVQVGSRRGKLTIEDFVFLIRKDQKKFARARELLKVNEDIEKARRSVQGNKEY